ncbi:MAG: hypothetical protein A2Z04_00980 [Chloroflexi bacterium RBG_16_57_9]|nr:MAG: hypothetical protein A2Z04_00980 [Chloroflexi bacterium RBG_16_57_9]
MSRDLMSFVLRLVPETWTDGSGPHVRWRGVIRNVQDGSEQSFTTLSDAILFIQRYFLESTQKSLAGGLGQMPEENVIGQSMEAWEKFTKGYTEMWLNAFSKTMEQSVALRSQIDQTVNQSIGMWGLPSKSEQERTLRAVESLQTQVAELATKLDKLEKAAKKPAPEPAAKPARASAEAKEKKES